MTNLLEKLRQLMQQRKTQPQKQTMLNSAHIPPNSSENRDNSTGAALNAAIVKNLMDMLDRTQKGMYSCEETFDLLDEYVELIDDNEEEAAALMPYVKRHLDKCPDCHAIYATLLHILQSEPSATTG